MKVNKKQTFAVFFDLVCFINTRIKETVKKHKEKYYSRKGKQSKVDCEEISSICSGRCFVVTFDANDEIGHPLSCFLHYCILS